MNFVPFFHSLRAGCVAILSAGALLVGPVSAQITKPDDAPRPLTPAESLASFRVPAGFAVELVAAEPLVREPSGVCWDERGDLYVCELHGYNLEGQYDIEELNRTGELDRVVRRVQADEKHQRAAEAETYGTIRKLIDSNGDGQLDHSVTWADRLPPCLGICATRGGIIAACQTEILFLADRDGDGVAEWREVLFEGFRKGPLERSINSPTWHWDGWIYFGRGAGGGTIRGPHLGGRDQPGAVELPNTDFRIWPDGSAIEPIVGGTATMGFAFTEAGDRFTISTRTPGIFVAPIEWRYLARNQAVVVTGLEQSATTDQRVYPTSPPHPWRTRRAEDPGFAQYYSDRYGIEESAPNGYFTSACSPLVYQDVALPGLRGQLLACEPAQNLIHRSLVRRDGSRLTLHRPESETTSEFFASTDPWFHAIALAHAPDGSLLIVDFYREIIEDYSAIPRYLQQLYGLNAGQEHGRVWRLTHRDQVPAPAADMSQSSAEELATQVASPHHWRRMTANRLLIERGADPEALAKLTEIATQSAEPTARIVALQTLAALDELTPEPIATALDHADPAVRRQAIRLAERWLADPADSDRLHPTAAPTRAAIERIRGRLLDPRNGLAADPEPMVRLQLALSLGESPDPASLAPLATLARQHGQEPWLAAAILTAVPGRMADWLAELLRDEGPGLGDQAAALLEPFGQTVGNGRDPEELARTLRLIAKLPADSDRAQFFRGLRASLRSPVDFELPDDLRGSLVGWTRSPDASLRAAMQPLVRLLKLETAGERAARLATASEQVQDVQLSVEERLIALGQLADETDSDTTDALIAALAASTPALRDAILAELVGSREHRPRLLAAIRQDRLPRTLLTAVQWQSMIDGNDPEVSELARSLQAARPDLDEALYRSFLAGLQGTRDPVNGRQVFVKHCANCHHAHGLGHGVGPDLSAEFRRAEETILRDVIAPSETISAGYATYTVATDSLVFSGVLVAESPTSLTLRQAEGKEVTILRKDIEQFRVMPVSLMPEDLIRALTPQDFADLLTWLRSPPKTLVLLDEDPRLAESLNEGTGTAQFLRGDAFRGEWSLVVTPPQRYSPRIADWRFPIRQHPGPGEYRYVRFAWKAPAASGVMLELADDGAWPAADQALRRYHAGKNTTGWQSVEIASESPADWIVVTRDLWSDFGDLILTGIAPTALGGPAQFDALELLQSLP